MQKKKNEDTVHKILANVQMAHLGGEKKIKIRKKTIYSQVQKIPNLAYQIYQTLQIYWVYEKDYIKYKYDRKWKTENMAEKHNFQE